MTAWDSIFPVPAPPRKYGFADFRLKGGVLEPEEELKAVRAIKAAFPDARVDLAPNGRWSLVKSLEPAPELKKVLAYCSKGLCLAH